MQTTRKQWALMLQIIAVYLAVFVVSIFVVIPWSGTQIYSPLDTFTTLSGNITAMAVIFMGVFLVGILLIRKLTTHQFWQLFFSLTAFAGLFTTFTQLFVLVQLNGWILFLAATGITTYVLFQRVYYHRLWFHNSIVVCSVAGLAQLFGTQLAPVTALSALIILAVYDVVITRISHAPLQVAKQLFSREAFFGCIIPQRLSAWRLPLQKKETPLFILGGADIAFPTFFAISQLWYAGTYAFMITALAICIAAAGLVLLSAAAPKRSIPSLLPLALACFLSFVLVSQL